VVDTLKGEAFGFLGFDLRRVRKRKGNGHYLQMTPKKKARKAIKAKVRDIMLHSGATPMPKVVVQINASLAGWVNYLRVGSASGALSEVRQYAEMKVRTLLSQRKRRRKTSIGWRRWSNEDLYGVLGMYWDWKVQPLPGVANMWRICRESIQDPQLVEHCDPKALLLSYAENLPPLAELIRVFGFCCRLSGERDAHSVRQITP
jgi:hypothetical protein